MSRYIDAENLDCVSYQGVPDGYEDSFDSGVLYAMNLVDEQPTVDVVPVSVIDQIKWERDSFAEQIREIGGEPFKKWECTDVVRVVRCGECKHRMIASSEEGTHYHYCAKHDHAIDTDWFCADGEKVTE